MIDILAIISVISGVLVIASSIVATLVNSKKISIILYTLAGITLVSFIVVLIYGIFVYKIA